MLLILVENISINIINQLRIAGLSSKLIAGNTPYEIADNFIYPVTVKEMGAQDKNICNCYHFGKIIILNKLNVTQYQLCYIQKNHLYITF
ncbi:MAG: hypothetical protein ACREV6_01430 [Clostridium sp.]|uniref:hypothetical protein n=1 Tax=Clostridium sp. TaxID=1506 RepID=UPI003D6D028B